MTEATWWTFYIIGYLITAVGATVFIMRDNKYGVDGSDAVLGCALALLWPLIWFIAAIYYAAKKLA